MGYNALSGSPSIRGGQFVLQTLTASQLISGSLLYGDGINISNVPRIVANGSPDNILTVGANSYSLVGEPNLTFNGSRLLLTGELTASVGVSASYFEGDGSRLTGIAGAASDDNGIFTVIDSSNAYVTSSLNIGSTATPAHKLSIVGASLLSGGVIHKRVYKTSDYTVTATDYYVAVDTTGGTIELTFPAAATTLDGQTWVIKDEGGAANSNNITITGSDDSNTIEGTNQIVLNSSYAAITLYCNGVDKYFVY
jgi:hypothetical protein